MTAIKAQLTEAMKNGGMPPVTNCARFHMAFPIFARYMPAEQAKHATRKYLANLA